MLVDPETLRISAMVDFECTNILSAPLTYDPPWWLLSTGPEIWVDRGSTDEFLGLYEPRMEQFLKALEWEEGELGLRRNPVGGSLLSVRMCDSWRIGRFWFDYAARKSFKVDSIYWVALHHEAADLELLHDKAARPDILPY
ncbi:hypothetical protein P152DRAFT_466235 [Eremomyces bilateralis CBS 781.70]|uniref:Aminoglycoside phosphotransferase domain-containing protein n=1 Tax=Eremomyces bilateralis CBS 781.70 TaxID=1392243 RepID=A0A6G1G4E6_9PEZI|nr:uncharacterized protein P152DRAFT_466235 [Eremomyces bilateralis CBS 781.70]KAF1812898.1 hypothetical protein P152DRAFT_466235 [Eremomyces bilateralis CBS 781.70]